MSLHWAGRLFLNPFEQNKNGAPAQFEDNEKGRARLDLTPTAKQNAVLVIICEKTIGCLYLYMILMHGFLGSTTSTSY